ncbi:hypothetical protein KY309_02485 [Candidatus Woesearchaeota archaeon]|nr:hypothetical protein [Candidatus Woesearchaeota archaeon]MBW3016453.1 hypothetical protein [Candidatus Woesearchaeota archaeon]
MKEKINAVLVHGFDRNTGIGIELTYDVINRHFQLRGHTVLGAGLPKTQVDYAERALPKYLQELTGALMQERAPVTAVTPIRRGEYVGKGRIIDGRLEIEMTDGKPVVEEDSKFAKLEVRCKCSIKDAQAILERFAERTKISEPRYSTLKSSEPHSITTTK